MPSGEITGIHALRSGAAYATVVNRCTNQGSCARSGQKAEEVPEKRRLVKVQRRGTYT